MTRVVGPALVLLLVLCHTCAGGPGCQYEYDCSLIACGIPKCDYGYEVQECQCCPSCIEGPDSLQQQDLSSQGDGSAVVRNKRRISRVSGSAKRVAQLHTHLHHGSNIPQEILEQLRKHQG